MDARVHAWSRPATASGANRLAGRRGRASSRGAAFSPARAQEVCGHLRPAVAREHALVVQAPRARRALTRLEVCEVPNVHANHEGPRSRDVEIAANELELIFLAPH